MSTKRQQDVRGLLLEGNFGISRDLPPSDPLTTTQMVLEVERIKPYDRNPRREINPRYDDIKASVRAQGGLNNPLTITRRPGDETFMVEAGGNTRLLILQELWHETSDARFKTTQCLYVPWRSESHVLGAHLIENELRGDMRLIDKALALKDLQKLLSAETGKALNRSELQRQLTALGYTISRRQLSRYLYAAECLEPLIPKALRAGLGRYHVDQLRAVEGAYRNLFEDLPIPNPDFQSWFATTVSKLDRDDLTLQEIGEALEHAIAKISGLSCPQIRQRIEALLHDNVESRENESIDSEFALTPTSSSNSAAGIYSFNTDVKGTVSTITISKRSKGNGGARKQNAAGSPREADSTERSPGHDQHPQSSMPERNADDGFRETIASRHQPPTAYDLDAYRQQAYGLANQLAEDFGFGDAIQAWNGGYGFTVDLIEPGFADDQRWVGWWLLLGISEQAISADRLSLLPRGHRLADQLRFKVEDALYEQMGKPPAVSVVPFHLLQSRQLTDQALEAFWRLIVCCRAMRRHTRESDLWACLTVEQSRLRTGISVMEGGQDG
jgi:ParB family protein of integrating conjugative element (PFGI_1 class)